LLPKCPICGKPMKVTELKCPHDNVKVSGYFDVSPLAFLDDEDMNFVIMFLRTKGNLKEMERLTGVGYFALRGRLNKLLEKLNLKPIGEEERVEEDVIEKFKKGVISLDDALAILKKRKGGKDNGRSFEENP